MTLKTRNQLLNFFFIASVVAVAVTLIFFIISITRGTIITPPDYRIPPILARLPLAKPHFIALMLSFAILMLYIPVCFFMILHYFENTQTSEIIFFTGFLIGALAELSRFLTICFGLWQTFSNILIFSGKIVLFGRTIIPLSFVCASLFSDTSQRQDVERNYMILVLASIVFAIVIPMNTARISSTGLVTEGFMVLINILRILLALVAFFSFFTHGIKKNNADYKQIAYSFLLLIAGYAGVVSADTLLLLIPGTVLLFFGTYQYLKNLHKMYMWS